MTNAERTRYLDESDQRTLRTVRGLRAVAAALLVAGLLAAIVTELPLPGSSVADARASEEITNPLPTPGAVEPPSIPSAAPGSAAGSPEEFQDRMPTPPSVIVG